MHDAEPTWLLMIRDLSESVTVDGQSGVAAGLVLDADTGLVRGVSIAETPAEACAEAVDAALTQAVSPLPPGPPVRVVHREDDAAVVMAVLARAFPDEGPEVVISPGPLGEAEDIFDSLVGHLAGRGQPSEAPSTGDWRFLYTQIHGYCVAQPWLRWSDSEPLDLELSLSGTDVRYCAVVMGQAGIQRGLSLYPVPEPDSLDLSALDADSIPPGSLMLWLDPRDEVPSDYVAKADRHGWSEDSLLVPLPLTMTADGPADLDRAAARHLTLGVAAVVGLLARGSDEATGRVLLAEGDSGTYTVRASRG